MVREPEAMPFWEALALLEGKEAVASAMTTAEWRRMPVAVRLKSQFSATLTSVKAAKAITDYLTGYVRGDKAVNDSGQEYQVYQGRAEFVAQMRDIMIAEGFGKVLHDGSLDPEIHDNDLRDLRGCRRLQLIFDTQTEQAASFAQWQEGQDPDVLDVYPCQRFVRVRPVHTPRPYHDAAIGTIRRKDDLAFWVSLNRDFQVPWGPWGFNSGCGVEDVDRDEAEAEGVIKPTDKVRPIAKDFLEGLNESIRGLDDQARRYIQAQLDNQVRFLGDSAFFTPKDQPHPAIPAQTPPVRPAKTPEQIDAQKKRIGETIAARQQRQKDQRAAIDKTVRADFNARRDTALSILKEKMHSTLQQYRQDNAISSWEAFVAASDAYHKAAKSWNPGGMLYKAMIKDIVQRQAKIWDRTYRDSLRYLATEGMLIPRDNRGMIVPSSVIFDKDNRIKADKPRKLSPNIRKGLDLMASIVPASKLPEQIGLQIVRNGTLRAFCLAGNIKITDQHIPSTMAHEIAHAVEFNHPDILRKSAAFLYDRSNGEPAKPLIQLVPGINYRPNEIAFEDKWAERGSKPYAGKIYANGYYPTISRDDFVNSVQASEILSMGIQRILEDPASFQQQDPDYFNFIKSQLRSS